MPITPERLADARAALDKIREIHRRVRECPRHLFETMPQPRMGEKLTCSTCNGEVSAVDAFTYVRGFMAAGGDPLVVAPWWMQAHELRAGGR